jgi:hypothetical protein
VRWLALLMIVACSSGRPPVPELDADDWCHVQELARPDRPNGPTGDLEAAIAIADHNRWFAKLDIDDPTTISRESLPDFARAITLLRRWRDANGGVLLMTPLGRYDAAEQQISLWLPLLGTRDPEATRLVGLISERTIAQAHDLLNLSIAFAMTEHMVENAKVDRQPIALDVRARRRAIIRAIAGEVVWMRGERERDGAHDAYDNDALRELDHTILTLVTVLRDVGPDTSESELKRRLVLADHGETNTDLTLKYMAEMISKLASQTHDAETANAETWIAVPAAHHPDRR